MKKRLTESEFQAVVKDLNIMDQTKNIAYAVLVRGESQSALSRSLNLSRAAISQAVSRVFPAQTKNRLTDQQFQAAIKNLNIGEKTKNLAYAVLVKGQSQTALSQSLGITQATISKAASRVRAAHVMENLPEGYQRVEAVLTTSQAYQVRIWAAAVSKKLGLDT